MKKETKKEGKLFLMIFISVFIILILISTVSAGWFDWLKKTITGKDISDTASVNISISNIAPQIIFVDSIPAQSVTENGVKYIYINFTAYDANGASDLDDSSAMGAINLTGEINRTNSSCAHLGDFNTNYANYTCEIGIWYFDGADDWTVNATIKDNGGSLAQNLSTTFTLNEDTCMAMGPTALEWPSLSVTDTDTKSNTDPITINNTCNDAITDGNVKVKAIDLAGETNSSQLIYAGNFTVNPSDACEGTSMVNNSAEGVSGATLPKGNYSTNDGSIGQEQLFFCLEAMNPDLSSQSYSTGGGEEWTISIVA